MKSQVAQPSSKFYIDHRVVLVRRLTIDGSIKVVVPTLLQQRILSLAHCPSMAERPVQRKMYGTLICGFFVYRMATDVYRTLEQCSSNAHNLNCCWLKRLLQLLLPSGLLSFLAIDSLRMLPKTRSGIQYVVVVTNCYFKLTRATPSSKTASTIIANTFLDTWIIS